MLKDYKNKILTPDEVENKSTSLEQSFAFAETGEVIKANSYEEALKKKQEKKDEGKK